jgi:hypothetical protein
MNRNAQCFPEQRGEARAPHAHGEGDDEADEVHSAFWPWFAVGVLLFGWIAEASMCAQRGF